MIGFKILSWVGVFILTVIASFTLGFAVSYVVTGNEFGKGEAVTLISIAVIALIRWVLSIGIARNQVT